ncbi:MAG: ribonuclease HI [Fastidiosipila sp.]|nr:ribonuclease HI [Fastidiosipila sp.]
MASEEQVKSNNKLSIVEIYTDGACSGNPGPGGWAAILCYRGVEKEISGFEKHTTNNRMELTAALMGLRALKRPCRVRLYSDSAYLVSAFNEKWLDNWLRNSWKNAAGTAVSNIDLWKELLKENDRHQITWIKVKGHSNHKMNDRVDQMAVDEIKKNT